MSENTDLDKAQRQRRPGWVPYVSVHGILRFFVPLTLLDAIIHYRAPEPEQILTNLTLGICIGHAYWAGMPEWLKVYEAETSQEKSSATTRESSVLVVVGMLSVIVGINLLPAAQLKSVAFLGMWIIFGAVMCVWGTVRSRSVDGFPMNILLTLAVLAWALIRLAH